MKTNNLSKKSFLTTMILALSAGLMSIKGGEHSSPGLANGYIGGGSPIYIPRHRRFKGYDRENRKCTFNKNK